MKLFALLFALLLWLPVVGTTGNEQVRAALIQPYASASSCATHNPRLYHGLWNYTLGCHYDHEHGDSPTTANDIFGTGYYTIAGGSISYPWQTPGENEGKHNSYKWIVRRDLPCVASQYIVSPGCITDFRAQVHADMFNMVSDYHSFAVEMRLCLIADPANCGIFRFGGWQFAGDMTIDGHKIIDRADPPNLPIDQRIEQIHAAGLDDPRQTSWYVINPGPAHVRVVHRTHDTWGYYQLPSAYPITTTLTISDYHFFCESGAPGCVTNDSKTSPDVVRVDPGGLRAIIDADNNLVADWQGYVDRYGNVVSGCTVVSLDCIAVSFEHVPLPLGVWYQWRVPFTDTTQIREHDISFNEQSSGWISFPN